MGKSKGKEYRLSKAKPNMHGYSKEPRTIDDVFKRAYYALYACDWQDFSEACGLLANNTPDGAANLWEWSFFNLLSEMTLQDDDVVSENGRRIKTIPHPSKLKKRSLAAIKKDRKAIKIGMMLEEAGADKHGHFEKACDMLRQTLKVKSSNDGYSDETLRKLWQRFKEIRHANKRLSLNQ